MFKQSLVLVPCCKDFACKIYSQAMLYSKTDVKVSINIKTTMLLLILSTIVWMISKGVKAGIDGWRGWRNGTGLSKAERPTSMFIRAVARASSWLTIRHVVHASNLFSLTHTVCIYFQLGQYCATISSLHDITSMFLRKIGKFSHL